MEWSFSNETLAPPVEILNNVTYLVINVAVIQ